MPLICLECFTRYDAIYETIILSSFTPIAMGKPCVLKGCQGDVVSLDELIAPAIVLLNEKGYATNFCCSGHALDTSRTNSFYVSFDSAFFFQVIGNLELKRIIKAFEKSLPEVFELEVNKQNKNTLCIRSKSNENQNSTIQDRMKRIAEINLSFFDWANTLPDIEEFFRPN